MIDDNTEGASVPQKDFTVAVIPNNTGIVAITPLKHGDTDAMLVFRQTSEKTNT